MTETKCAPSGVGTPTPDHSGSYGQPDPKVPKTSNEGKGTAPIGGPVAPSTIVEDKPPEGEGDKPQEQRSNVQQGGTPTQPATVQPTVVQPAPARPATPAGVTPTQPGVAPQR